MSDGITVNKIHISATKDLYGCEIDALPINRPYEIKKHKAQIKRARALSEKLYDEMSAIGRRIVRVNNAANWNQLMLDNLEKVK